MFNGDIIIEKAKARKIKSKELMYYVFGANSHRTMNYFAGRHNIDTKYLEKIAEFFDEPLDNFFIRQGVKQDLDKSSVALHNIEHSTVNVNTNEAVLHERIKSLEQQLTDKTTENAWLKKQWDQLLGFVSTKK